MFGTYEGPVQPTEAFNAILHTSETSPLVCNQRPTGVTEAAVFLVNTNKLRHKDDLKADDVGGWCHKGKPKRFYSIEWIAPGEVHAELCGEDTDGAFKLTRIYYHHKGTTEFRKTIFYIHSKFALFVYVCLLYCNKAVNAAQYCSIVVFVH